MNLNEQCERQETICYFYSMGTDNEQGNLTLIWRTTRGARYRRHPEEKNSLLFDHQAQDKLVQAVRRTKKYTLIQLIRLETKLNWFDHVFLQNLE